MIIDVVLPIPVKNFFSYFCAETESIAIGSRVLVSLKNRNLIGIIIFIHKNNLNRFQLKNIIRIIDNKSIFIPSVWNLILWCVDYYQCFIGIVIFSIIPSLLKQGKILKKKYIFNGKLLKKVCI